MTSQRSKHQDLLFEGLLSNLGNMGDLYDSLTEVDIEALLSKTSPESMSKTFKERAFAAMREAQAKREIAISANELGNELMLLRREAGLEVKELSRAIGVNPSVIEALEAGELNPRQIMHNFPVSIMRSLLEKLQYQIKDFVGRLLEMTENVNSRSGFSETQAAFRKHTQTNTDLLIEVTEYIAQLETLGNQD